MELFGVGIGEAGLVLLITLLVVGPERFPQIAREGAKYYRMARRFTAEVTGDLTVALKELENEVNEQAGDLKAVREIGDEVRAGVSQSASDIDSISRGAAEAASGPGSSGDTSPSAAAPEARREAPPMDVPVGGDPFARVAAVYKDYHTTSEAPSETPAATPSETPEQRAARIVGDPFAAPTAEGTRDADGDELSRQAVEAFDEFRKPAASTAADASPTAASTPVPAPASAYSPQQIVGVNPFAGADLPPPPAPAPASPPEASTEGTDEPASERAEHEEGAPASTPAPRA